MVNYQNLTCNLTWIKARGSRPKVRVSQTTAQQSQTADHGPGLLKTFLCQLWTWLKGVAPQGVGGCVSDRRFTWLDGRSTVQQLCVETLVFPHNVNTDSLCFNPIDFAQRLKTFDRLSWSLVEILNPRGEKASYFSEKHQQGRRLQMPMLYHKGFLIRLAIVNLSPFNLDFDWYVNLKT